LVAAGFFWPSPHEPPVRSVRPNHVASQVSEPPLKAESKPVTPPLPIEAKLQPSPPTSVVSPTVSAPTVPRATVRAAPVTQHSSPPKALEPSPKTVQPHAHEVTVGNFDQANPYSE
jgi:hypothetical protein